MAIFKSYTLNVDTITAKSQNKSFWDSVVKTAYDQIVEYFTNVYKLSGGNLTCHAYQTYKKGVYLSCNFVSSSGTVDIIWKVRTSNGTDTYICMSGCSDVTFSHTVPSPSADHGGSTGEDFPFQPPQPSNSKKIEDVPFYQDLKNSGEIGSFDDLTQAEFDYLQDTVQKGEVGLFDTLVNTAKDFFMGSSKDSDVFRDVNISYDGDNPDIVAYYANNGLDTSKSYNINMDGIRVGYKDNGTIHPITTGANINKNGVYVVSKETKDKFLSDGEMYVAHTEVGSGGFTTPNIVSNVGTGAVIGLLTSGAIDNVAENTVDMLQKGITYVVSKGKNMYQDFTNTGDRSKDLFNHAVQSEAYKKGIQTVVGGAGVVANGGVVSGKVDIDFDGKSIPVSVPSSINIPMSVADGAYVPMNLADGVALPGLTLAPGVSLPDVGLDIGVKTIPVNVTGKSIPISTGGEVALKVADTTKVKLDIPDDVALPVDGLDANFKAVYAAKVANIGKVKTILGNKIESHNLEYVADGGIRAKEGKAANWVDEEYKTTVAQGTAELNGVQRKVKAWVNIHSGNASDTFGDSIGNDLVVPEGLIPALGASGLAEGVREILIHQANTNVSDMAKGKQRQKDDDDQDDTKSFMDLFSILFSFTSSVDESLLPDEVKGVLETFKSLGLSKHTIGGGS